IRWSDRAGHLQSPSIKHPSKGRRTVNQGRQVTRPFWDGEDSAGKRIGASETAVAAVRCAGWNRDAQLTRLVQIRTSPLPGAYLTCLIASFTFCTTPSGSGAWESGAVIFCQFVTMHFWSLGRI